MDFRHCNLHLVENVDRRKRVARIRSDNVDKAQNVIVCYLVNLSEIGLKRGRCHQCQLMKEKPPRYTLFGCGVCGVRPPVFQSFTRHSVRLGPESQLNNSLVFMYVICDCLFTVCSCL